MLIHHIASLGVLPILASWLAVGQATTADLVYQLAEVLRPVDASLELREVVLGLVRGHVVARVLDCGVVDRRVFERRPPIGMHCTTTNEGSTPETAVRDSLSRTLLLPAIRLRLPSSCRASLDWYAKPNTASIGVLGPILEVRMS